jgi:zinc protease
MRILLLALALLQGAPAAPVERFTLGNGLRVILRPVDGATKVAVTVLYDFGENADPAGRSGLAHLCEHLYATSPAGSRGATPVEEIDRTHPGGWNAQTGWDYTVFSAVVPPEDLAGELGVAVARMAALAPGEADLRRERPRLLDELENMYARSSALASMNLARRPLCRERAGRFGGLPEEVTEITLDEARAFLRAKYWPARARLVLAGALDAATWGPRVREIFSLVPAGADGGPAAAGPVVPGSSPAIRTVPTGADAFRQGRQACLGWRAPRPGDEGYAPFLVLAVRLWTRQARDEKEPRERPKAIFAPLDEPDVLFVRAGAGGAETPEDAVKRVEAFVRGCIDAPLRAGEEKGAKVHLSNYLGTLRSADAMVAANPYLVAFGLARRDQLGVDGEALAKALDAVTDESLAAARRKWFGTPSAVVTIPD